MRRVVLSLAAIDDRRRITGYTVRRFGVLQARRFRDAFENTLRRLAGSPQQGRERPEIDPPGRRFRYYPVLRTFLIVYEQTEDELRVVRLLHGARDLAQELDELPGDE